MLTQRKVVSWSRVLKALQAVLAHGLLFTFTIFLAFKLDHAQRYSWWIVFSPLWLFHGVIARGRFSLPAPALPNDRHWAPSHAIMAMPLLIAFELLLCVRLEGCYVVNLKVIFLPLLAFEIAILVDNIRMCRALMPGDEESMTDEAIWETLPHFWIAISMIFLIAATIFTLLKLCGDVATLGWWDLFINFGIAECFAFLVCTKWYNPAIHRQSSIGESSSSTTAVRYLDWSRGIIVSADDDQHQNMRMCNLQAVGGHIMKIPFICFQIMLFMYLEGTPSSARNIPFRVIFAPLLLLQATGVLFAAYRLVEKIYLLVRSASASGRYWTIASKARDCLGFLHHGSRLLGWWSIDEGSQEELAKLYLAETSGYNTFAPDTVRKLPKNDLIDEIWKLQAALSAQSEITKHSRHEYERLQNDKILCRICFDEQISIVLLPCRHHVLCRTCGEKCKKCPICRVFIEERLPIYHV